MRQSNLELLRIISMFFILIVHFDGAALGLPMIMTLDEACDFGVFSKEIIESVAIIGVNCFVLISGYFGIKFSVKGLSNFLLWCVFYSVFLYLIVAPFTGKFSISGFLLSFLAISHTDLWFVPAYFGLYILSPLLNAGIKNLSEKQYTWLLIGILFLNVYLGWLNEDRINTTGYNIMQLIMLYFIGRYIGLYLVNKLKYINKIRLKISVLYIICVLMIFSSTFFFISTKAFAYNSPFVLGASVLFFLMFTTFRYYNSRINWIASSAFAVYLIHKNIMLWYPLKCAVIYLSENYNYIMFTVLSLILMIIIFAGAVLFDKVRMRITNPVVKWITGRIANVSDNKCMY